MAIYGTWGLGSHRGENTILKCAKIQTFYKGYAFFLITRIEKLLYCCTQPYNIISSPLTLHLLTHHKHYIFHLFSLLSFFLFFFLIIFSTYVQWYNLSCFTRIAFLNTVNEKIFVGEKFRTFPFKTFRMEFNSALSN